jgi:RNA polymerase sigma-70 factor (ECF subfamily)
MTAIDWQQALAEHARWLRTVVLARVGERGAVEEVLQEVALAAVRQRAPLVDRDRLAPWLYRLAVRQSLLYRRKLGRRRRLHARYAERTQPSERDPRAVEPLDWLLADERRQQLRQGLSRLARRDAEILLLKYTEDWSYQQLARHLGISPSAVEARLHRARQRLREALIQVEAGSALVGPAQ